MGILVVGLGKLGLCTATCFAELDHDVIGYDMDEERLKMIKAKKCYIDEPGLKFRMKSAVARRRLTVTNSLSDAIKSTNRMYIIVPTPSDEAGEFSNRYILDVLTKASSALIERDEFYVINIVSTVMPGSCAKFIKYLEANTGLKCGTNFGLTYNPEFIAIGSVLDDFMHPDMTLIGYSDHQSCEIIENDYGPMRSLVCCMPLLNAEITKLSLNYALALKISFANELAALCEHIPGANVEDIASAIGCDSRIGGKFLNPGLGFGGPCLPRDNVAFAALCRKNGYHSRLSPATLKINEDVINRIVLKIMEHTSTDYYIDIFGTSYKSGTTLTEGSQSILLKDKLKEFGYRTRTFDQPISYEKEQLKSPAVIVMMSDNIPLPDISGKNILLIDPWRRFGQEDDRFTYYGMGIGQ